MGSGSQYDSRQSAKRAKIKLEWFINLNNLKSPLRFLRLCEKSITTVLVVAHVRYKLNHYLAPRRLTTSNHRHKVLLRR